MRKYVFLFVFVFLFVGLSGCGDAGVSVSYFDNGGTGSGVKDVNTVDGLGEGIRVKCVRSKEELEKFVNSGQYEIVAVKSHYSGFNVHYFDAEVYYRTKKN